MACPTGTDDFHFGGEPAYTAPEVLDGEPADERSDIFSLGITAYELVTGEKPFPGASPKELLTLIRTRDIPDPALKSENLPQPLKFAIQKACRRDPGQRYQKVREMAADIREFLQRICFTRSIRIGTEANIALLFLDMKHHDKKTFDPAIAEFKQKIETLGGAVTVEGE
jgi:serine/threonine protein kinase